ncbi:hypothetical protein [Pikeienuella sp. HZG-20]|uniref:hypothetical protein n=1 Tax=Paludibacillus litoralis TaxID=3133267 RepID=UPI0030EB3775
MATKYLTLPASLRVKSFIPGMIDGLSQNRGPYSPAERRLETGGEFWVAALDLVPMEPEMGQQIQALSYRLMRADAALQLGPPSRAVKRGTTSDAALTLDGPAAAGATDIDVAGLGAGRTLLAGSYITLDAKRLHQVVEDVTADGAGKATLVVLPRLRSGYSGGTFIRVKVADLRSVWRLSASPRLAYDAPVFSPVRLELYEAVEV